MTVFDGYTAAEALEILEVIAAESVLFAERQGSCGERSKRRHDGGAS